MSTKKKKNNPEQAVVAKATIRQVRMSPQKARLMLNLIKGMQVEAALQVLQFSPKKTARIAKTLLESAIANAKEGSNADIDRLWITGGQVGQGGIMKRFLPRAQGRATPLKKRFSHMTILLGEK